jgi:electron transfer flavoprotein alpha subunit
MAVLLLADHDGRAVSQPTRSAVAACGKLGEVHVLVLGEGAAAAAPAAAAMPGVAKVLLCEDASLANRLAEPLAALLVQLAPGYSHLAAPASAAGKNVMPRVAACSTCSRSATSRAWWMPTPSCAPSMPATRWPR